MEALRRLKLTLNVIWTGGWAVYLLYVLTALQGTHPVLVAATLAFALGPAYIGLRWYLTIPLGGLALALAGMAVAPAPNSMSWVTFTLTIGSAFALIGWIVDGLFTRRRASSPTP